MDMLRTCKFFLVSIILFWIVGCSGTSTTPSALPTETAAPLSQPITAPSATDSPVATSAPTLTPEPGLRTSGPYFSYFRQVGGVYQLVLMDADGGGRKVIQLPKEIGICSPCDELNIQDVSPDGHWLAFYTGYAGDFDGQFTRETFDLTLNLLNLNTGDVQVITPLLSKDYPNNFVAAAKEIDPSYITPADLQYAFMAGITRAVNWSPDGRYLAFAGQMNGPSSDLYVYNMVERSIKRLTAGPEELQWVDWSSDGKWILHGSVYAYGEGMQYSIYAVTADGSIVHDLPGGQKIGRAHV